MHAIPETVPPAQREYETPKTADGKTDWDHHQERQKAASTQFYWSPEEKQAHEQRQLKLIADVARIEEAKTEQARIKAGSTVPRIDLAFSSREPRDVLRRAAPPPYDFDDVPRAIGEFAWYFSQATGYDQSGAIVASVTAAASVIDDAYRLTVRPESKWTVSAR